jgi:organic hydroperoxide reductase OsmC/OhrA
MASQHRYPVTVSWDQADKGPVVNYGDYSRAWLGEREGKPVLAGSADPSYKGDPAAWNPEDLLVASLSACHLLTYLALAASKKLVVHSYEDSAEGLMQIKDGRMRVTDVVLKPKIGLAEGSDVVLARSLHGPAHDQCFIANSVTVEITVEPEFFIVN